MREHLATLGYLEFLQGPKDEITSDNNKDNNNDKIIFMSLNLISKQKLL